MAVWQSLVSCQNLSKISTWTLLQLLYWLKTKEQNLLHWGRVKFFEVVWTDIMTSSSNNFGISGKLWRLTEDRWQTGEKTSFHLGRMSWKSIFIFWNIGTQDRHIQQRMSTSAHTWYQCDTNFNWTYPVQIPWKIFGHRTHGNWPQTVDSVIY